MLRIALSTALCLQGSVAHPCDTEVAVACPDRPAEEMATCLKNPSEHETPTVLSSECTDFVALNVACSADMETHCDEAMFSDDTVPCLTQWTDKEKLSEKCQGVVAWAVPGTEEDEEEDGPTDEAGMSEKDYKEKKEWQAKRKAARGDSIERLKMKEADAKKEQERVELETFKRENPEEYAQMIEQQEEDKRQAAAIKKRERMLAAALARKKREEAGLSAEEEDAPKQEEEKPKKQKKSKAEGVGAAPEKKSSSETGSFLSLLCGLGVVGLSAGGAFLALKKGGGSKGNAARKAAIASRKRQ